jgi:hypothetical protein
MSYYASKVVSLTFEDAVAKIKENLKNEGFGILTDTDIKATLKNKLGVDFRNYTRATPTKHCRRRTRSASSCPAISSSRRPRPAPPYDVIRRSQREIKNKAALLRTAFAHGRCKSRTCDPQRVILVL